MSKRDHKLIQAASEGDVSKIDELLSKNANVNFISDHHQFPLLVASQNGHKEAVQRLIDDGADVNLESREKVTSLSIASECGHHDAVEILIEKGARTDHQVSDGRTPLMLASQNGHVKTVRVLISKNVNVNQCRSQGTHHTAMSLAIENKHTEVVKELLPHVSHINHRNEKGYTHLICAAMKGLAEVASLLLEKGAHVDQRGPNGTTALIMASRVGHTETGDVLLKHGADVDLQDMDGRSALITTCVYNCVEFAKLLVSKNAEVDLRFHSTLQTALFIASSKGNKEIVEILVQHKANVNVIDTRGRTALSVACSGGYYEIVDMLIRNGANVKATRRGEELALSKAISCHSVDIVRLLLENKAEVSYDDLVYVCRSGLLDILKLLIPCVAGHVNGRENYDQSPLWWATRNNHKEIVSLLLENGANPDNGRGRISSIGNFHGMNRRTYASPLVLATINENVEILALLLEKGASTNEPCTSVIQAPNIHNGIHLEKVTPVMLAILASNSKLVEVFVKHGVNVMHHTNPFGYMVTSFTAIDVAAAVGNGKILQILEEAKDLPSHPPPLMDPEYVRYSRATASEILQAVRYVRDLVKHNSSFEPSSLSQSQKNSVLHDKKLSELFPKKEESDKDIDDERDQQQSFEPPTINDVFEILIPLASEWKNIGLLLRIKYDKLQTIEKDQSRSIDCVREMVTEWFKNIDSPPSWEVLEKSVRHFDQTIAHDIHTKYNSS